MAPSHDFPPEADWMEGGVRPTAPDLEDVGLDADAISPVVKPTVTKAQLAAALPGWRVWYASGQVWYSNGTAGWYAVPAPPGTKQTAALRMMGRVGPCETPEALQALCAVRYGWDDECDTCGVLARECGHRQPEQEN